ncbi:hypothetical protein ACFLXK_06465, partial [Chloroflexota bacterium]
TDSDGDGTADCLDLCPSDPAKTEPGICGCGVADTDSDGDGTADCLDQCPSDPAKTEPGICGCGTPDSADCDGDGIYNEVDPEPGTFTDDFNDGTTYGTIIDRGNQQLAISDESYPFGIRIVAASPGGQDSATIHVCNDAGLLSLDAGDEVVVTCGSVTVEVVTGTVEVTFTAEDGAQATADLNEGNNITFEPETFAVTNNGNTPAVVNVNGAPLTVNPGEELSFISSYIEINPDTLNLKSKGGENAITVYIELPSGFDVAQIDISTVKIRINGTAIGAQSKPTSVGNHDRDGIADRMVKFDRQALITALNGMTGDIKLIVSGKLNNGYAFTGEDAIKVINPGK